MEDNTRSRIERALPYIPESAKSPCIAPSFFRKARRRASDHVRATITSQSVPGRNIVLVRPRTLGQTNPKEHNGPAPMEGDEEIFEEEAVCKFCFDILKEENILKTECKCGNALIHEECAAKWSRTRGNNYCDSCGQEVQTFPVTLVRGLGSSTQVVDGEESNNKWSLFSWLMRLCWGDKFGLGFHPCHDWLQTAPHSLNFVCVRALYYVGLYNYCFSLSLRLVRGFGKWFEKKKKKGV